MLMMSQGFGCGKREAFSKDCGKPLLLGLSSQGPKVWEACGQARRDGAPLGSCGKRVRVFHGNGAQPMGFPCLSSPAPEPLAAGSREAIGLEPIRQEAAWKR